MGLHSRSSQSVWIKPFNHKPFIVSSLQDPIVLTEDSQLAVSFTVFDPDRHGFPCSVSVEYLSTGCFAMLLAESSIVLHSRWLFY